MIDLHAHSTFSDGTLTPQELAALGCSTGLHTLALTDHDSIGGIPAFLDACQDGPMQGISGVEMSAETQTGTLHMLGYFIKTDDRDFNALLERIRRGRSERNRTILAKLNELGLELEWDEVAAFAGEEVVGRPHFAQALMARGYIRNKAAAFDRYLAKGKPAYADRFRLPPAESIARIIAAEGVPVLAHPFTLNLNAAALRTFVADLKASGLQGIEVYYPEHSAQRQAEYLSLAREFDLVATGGSDFHGDLNPQLKLGSGFGSLCVSDDTVEALHARRP